MRTLRRGAAEADGLDIGEDVKAYHAALQSKASRGGGTGRRIGLKIRRTQKVRVGSIPTPGIVFSDSYGERVNSESALERATVPGIVPATLENCRRT